MSVSALGEEGVGNAILTKKAAVGAGVLLSTVVYLILVARHAMGIPLTAFGKNWAKDGLCQSFKGTLYDSQLLCFYIDTIWAITLSVLPKYGRPELQLLLQDTAGSIFFHGFGHAILWFFSPLGDVSLAHERPFLHVAVLIMMVYIFFFMFFRNFSAWLAHSQSALHAYLIVYWVPPLYQFTYVNTVLYGVMVSSNLANKTGGDVGHMLVSVPPMVMTWLEPLTCDTFLIEWGGHLWFDVSIPASVVVYYLWLVARMHRSKAE